MQASAGRGKEDLVALFFFFDFFQKFLSGLTLDAEFCKGHGFQTSLTDFDAALRTDPVCPFVEPGEGFINSLPPSITASVMPSRWQGLVRWPPPCTRPSTPCFL